MPVYEYECGGCKLRFERKQRFDEEPEVVCPECQGEARRVFHPAPIIFRGSGFYITDSRKGKGSGKKKEPEKDKDKDKDKEALPT